MPTSEGSMHLIQNKTGKLVLFRLGERLAIRVCLELSIVFSFVMLFMLAPVEIKYYNIVFDLVAVPISMLFTGKA